MSEFTCCPHTASLTAAALLPIHLATTEAPWLN